MYKFLRFMYETAVSYAATLALLMAVSPAHAATFNLFSPATGILKGMTSTYVTTSASYSDIVALFSGTCNSTTALRGDGSCGTLSTGTVTSVALTAPSVFTVTGSPITTSGTLALTFATGQTQNQVLASPNGSNGAVTLRSLVNADLANSAITINGTSTSLGGTRTLALASSDFANNGTTTTVLHGNAAGNPSFSAVSLTADVSGTLAAGSGGTGVATLTGIAKGNGTSAFTAAASSDVYGLWSGTCSSSTYLRGDGSCQTPPTGGTAANPTATIGLTAVNGSAGTYLRSDGAPALSQSIAPTWTGVHTFSPTTSTTTFNGVSNQWATTAVGFATTGQSYGSLITGGTSSADETIRYRSAALGNRAYLVIRGDGVTSFGNTTDNPTYSFLGTGTTTHNGPVIANTLGAADGVTVRYNSSNTPISLSALGANGHGYLGFNTVQTAASDNQTYATTNAATRVRMDGGTFTVATAASGTAGNTISWSDRITLANAGNVTINAPSSGTGLTVSGASASDPGLNIAAGTLAIAGAEGTAGQVLTSNGGSAAPSWTTPYSSGTFTASLSNGCTSTPTATWHYAVTGNMASVTAAFISCTSNSAALQITGLPAAVTPTTAKTLALTTVQDNGTPDLIGCAFISGTTLTFGLRTAGNSCGTSGFTSSGTKAIASSVTFMWSLD